MFFNLMNGNNTHTLRLLPDPVLGEFGAKGFPYRRVQEALGGRVRIKYLWRCIDRKNEASGVQLLRISQDSQRKILELIVSADNYQRQTKLQYYLTVLVKKYRIFFWLRRFVKSYDVFDLNTGRDLLITYKMRHGFPLFEFAFAKQHSPAGTKEQIASWLESDLTMKKIDEILITRKI